MQGADRASETIQHLVEHGFQVGLGGAAPGEPIFDTLSNGGRADVSDMSRLHEKDRSLSLGYYSGSQKNTQVSEVFPRCALRACVGNFRAGLITAQDAAAYASGTSK